MAREHFARPNNECIFNQQSAVYNARVILSHWLTKARKGDKIKSCHISYCVWHKFTPKAESKYQWFPHYGATIDVKEDCVLEDKTGSSVIHIWEPLVHTLTTGNSYYFINLKVRNLQGSTYLSTSPSTIANPTTVETLTMMIKSPQKEIAVTKLNLVSQLNTFCSSKVCKLGLRYSAKLN